MCVVVCVWLHSETQRELEERTHEVLDMDSALKERQGELQQRANLVQHTNKHTRISILYFKEQNRFCCCI